MSRMLRIDRRQPLYDVLAPGLRSTSSESP